LHESWNHNDHYHRVIIDVIGSNCQSALDIGCGQGALTRRLRQLVSDVTGMDRDERSIALARASANAQFPDIRYVQADFLAESIEAGSVDLVTAVASLHHMDAPCRSSLERPRKLPPGRYSLPISGHLAASDDLPADAPAGRARAPRRALPPPPVLAVLADMAQAPGGLTGLSG
jgi:SAM-dependent methyltransferase